MARAKEFTVTIEDRPGALAKCCLALAAGGVNILAFQSYVEEGSSLARFVVDDDSKAVAALGKLRAIFEEGEVAVARVPHLPGQMGRAAGLLGDANINIDYSYGGVEPGSLVALLVFGVNNLSLNEAAGLLDQLK